MSITIECPFTNCTYSTGEVPSAIAVELLAIHRLDHVVPNAPTVDVPRRQGPKLDRPKVDMGISMEDWNIFRRRWQVFRNGSGITEDSAGIQLFQCASNSLGDSMLKMDPNITTKPLDEVLDAMKTLAVIPIAVGALRSELLEMKQQRDEAFRSFSARVRGKAETCDYYTTSDCQCGTSNQVNYTEHIIRDVLIAGVYDHEIRRDILGIENIITRSVNDVIGLVEKREMARDANVTSATASAVSSFKRESRKTPPLNPTQSSQSSLPRDKRQCVPCPQCGEQFARFSESARGWNSKPHELCITCFRARRKQRKLHSKEGSVGGFVASEGNLCDNEVITQISTMSVVGGSDTISDGATMGVSIDMAKGTSGSKHMVSRGAGSMCGIAQPVRLGHHIFSSGEWRRARFFNHPTMVVRLSLQKSDYKAFSFTCPKIQPFQVKAKLDSCAQSCLWSLKECMQAGFRREDLIPVSLDLLAANKSPIQIAGALLARIDASCPSGKKTSCATMIYVSPSADGFYLSLEAMLDLGLLHSGSPLMPINMRPVDSSVVAVEAAAPDVVDGVVSGHECSCPRRKQVPSRPVSLPFSVYPENNEKMRDWLLHMFESSTFNTCPHQRLPVMSGPPVEIHVDEGVKPKAFHTPAPVPLHWQDAVRADLLRDEALGVIERVPYGEPVGWMHRMVINRKHDGSPRRTVDLSPLNKSCKRETFATESPVQMVRRIPKGTWKTVSDAWNGYHSMPLRESDRPLTTFITPYGRWRYIRAPQGFVSSGDGYNRRFDAVLSDFARKERCVDDTCHYDEDLTEHWWRTIDFLIKVGESGIVLNPAKFQFAQKVVEFAGFRISDDCI